MSKIRKVGVLGCGLMGRGIAQVSAYAGFETVARDIEQEYNERAHKAIEQSLDKFVEKGKIQSKDRDAALSRLSFTTELADLADCDIIVEAVTEDLEIKNAIWVDLDERCPDHTVFASNTSSLAITAMAAATKRADRFAGLHFFNPVPLMPLVEVIRAVTTSQDTFATVMEFAKSLGKTPIAAKDRTGFVVNRLLVPYLIDAIRALEQGVASVTDIDQGMTMGTGHPMGPFTLLDFVGLDTTLKIAEIMFDEFREPRFAPPPLLRRMVLAGMLGRKSGRGFYDYSTQPPTVSDLGL